MTEASTVHRICDLICLIRKKPRTVVEVFDLWKSDSPASFPTIRGYLRAMHAEGLIYISHYTRRDGQRGMPNAVWAWQPEPFENADAALDNVVQLEL
jgi:hypothetical protein